jgi:hypothetical protein
MYPSCKPSCHLRTANVSSTEYWEAAASIRWSDLNIIIIFLFAVHVFSLSRISFSVSSDQGCRYSISPGIEAGDDKRQDAIHFFSSCLPRSFCPPNNIANTPTCHLRYRPLSESYNQILVTRKHDFTSVTPYIIPTQEGPFPGHSISTFTAQSLIRTNNTPQHSSL